MTNGGRPAATRRLLRPPPCAVQCPGADAGASAGDGRGAGIHRKSPAAEPAPARSSVCVALCEMGRTDLVDGLIGLPPARPARARPARPARVLPVAAAAPLNAGAVADLQQAGVPVHFYRLGPDVLRLHLKWRSSTATGRRRLDQLDAGGLRLGPRDRHRDCMRGRVLGQLQAQFEADWQPLRPRPAALTPRPLAVRPLRAAVSVKLV